MKKKLLLFLICLCCSVMCRAQSHFLSRSYIGVNIGVQADQSINSEAEISQGAYYRRPDNTLFGIGHNYSLRIGYQINEHFFLESGFGCYNVIQTFNVESFIFGTEYKNASVRAGWSYIPIKIGIGYALNKKLSLYGLVGSNILLDRVSYLTTFGNPNGEFLTIKRGKSGTKPNPGIAVLIPNNYDLFSLLLSGGMRATYHVSPRLTTQVSLEITVGTRSMQTGVGYFYEFQSSGVAEAHTLSTIKGDALGLNFGLTYRLKK